MQQLLSTSEAALTDYRRRIVEAAEGNAQVIVDVIPEIELLIGPQAAVPDLPPAESQRRFSRVFCASSRVFCQPGTPLVVFLDDLQWADLATLQLMAQVMDNPALKYLLLIGAYRDNEVSANHPLLLTLNALRERGIDYRQMTLTPLSAAQVGELIADTLRAPSRRMSRRWRRSSSARHRATCFTNQFLKTLYDEKLLVFQAGSVSGKAGHRGWRWNIDRIIEQDITDNVVELMVGKLRELPPSTQGITAARGPYRQPVLARHAGHHPPGQPRSRAAGSDAGAAGPNCWRACRRRPRHFRFLHDQVQQAAYSLIAADVRQRLHHRIGRLLLENLSEAELEDRVFEVADHLNGGLDPADDDDFRSRLAELDLQGRPSCQAIQCLSGGARLP